MNLFLDKFSNSEYWRFTVIFPISLKIGVFQNLFSSDPAECYRVQCGPISMRMKGMLFCLPSSSWEDSSSTDEAYSHESSSGLDYDLVPVDNSSVILWNTDD